MDGLQNILKLSFDNLEKSQNYDFFDNFLKNDCLIMIKANDEYSNLYVKIAKYYYTQTERGIREMRLKKIARIL